MQQIFSDDATGPSRRPLINFPLPQDLRGHPDAVTASDRKRHRSPSQVGEKPFVATKNSAVSVGCRLTEGDRKAVRRFIEYGDQPMTAVEYFQKTSEHRSTPAQIRSSAVAAPSSVVPPQYLWCSVALRQALSVLCYLIRLDTASIYLQSTTSTSSTASGAPSTDAIVESVTQTARITTLELYCRYQALALEFEDVVLRAQAIAQADGAHEAMTQQAGADVEETVRCIEGAVNALEETLVGMLLPMEDPQQSKKDGAICAPSAASPSIEYVATLLHALPDVFHSEEWPARFVCNAQCEESMKSSPAQQSLGGGVAALLLGGDAGDAAAATYRAQVGGATTSLALQSLLDACKADVWNVFGVAAVSPISRLAALERIKHTSSGNALNDVKNTTAPPARPALDLAQLEFKDILVRAWNHGYGLLGLRRLCFEMQALFYPYIVRAQTPGSRPTSRASQQEMYQLWCNWRKTVQTLYLNFMKKVASGTDSVKETDNDDNLGKAESDTDLDACALMRQHALRDSALSEVQRITLRVVAKLQAVDAKGWFAVPAFDLVNVDFTSMRYWIVCPSFAHKSRREAYRSLCRVLERMVDSCVQRYGPTHAFSDVITNVRQQLVDVARAEGLL